MITSAGAYTPKPGYHGRGRAFDLATSTVADDKRNPLELLMELSSVLERELADSESRARIETGF